MKSIEVLSVPVTDQQRAKEFYLRMGLNLINESQFGDQTWIQLSFPGGETSITLVNWFDKMPAGSLQGVVIKTSDIQKDIDELKNRGIEVGKVDATPWGKFAGIKDPDGNGWSLHEA